ncbi:unnamed protein product, partial [Meganyctiphanes norvegica]
DLSHGTPVGSGMEKVPFMGEDIPRDLLTPSENGTMDVVPASESLYEELLLDNWPGSVTDDGMPCRIKHLWWWCLYCRTLKPSCMHTDFGGSDFCFGCEDLGCFAMEIPENGTLDTDYIDYFYDLLNVRDVLKLK